MVEVGHINLAGKVDALDPSSLKQVLYDKQATEVQKIGVVAEQFEAILTAQFMKEGLGKGFQTGYNAMAPEIFAQAMASERPFGISNILQSELLKQSVKHADKSEDNNAG